MLNSDSLLSAPAKAAYKWATENPYVASLAGAGVIGAGLFYDWYTDQHPREHGHEEGLGCCGHDASAKSNAPTTELDSLKNETVASEGGKISVVDSSKADGPVSTASAASHAHDHGQPGHVRGHDSLHGSKSIARRAGANGSAAISSLAPDVSGESTSESARLSNSSPARNAHVGHKCGGKCSAGRQPKAVE